MAVKLRLELYSRGGAGSDEPGAPQSNIIIWKAADLTYATLFSRYFPMARNKGADLGILVFLYRYEYMLVSGCLFTASAIVEQQLDSLRQEENGRLLNPLFSLPELPFCICWIYLAEFHAKCWYVQLNARTWSFEIHNSAMEHGLKATGLIIGAPSTRLYAKKGQANIPCVGVFTGGFIKILLYYGVKKVGRCKKTSFGNKREFRFRTVIRWKPQTYCI